VDGDGVLAFTVYNPLMRNATSRCVCALLLSATILAAGCESRDVQKDLSVVEVRTGWYDLGVVADGQTKIVPSISLKLKNISQKAISGVQIDAVFRSVKEPDKIIDEHFVPGVASNASLAPGDSTAAIVLRSKWGFTGSETRSQMLQNSHFVDAHVTILGRHGRNNWIKMSEVPIDRRLLTN
jgi:hypothetical protein